jgi:hypothetical protein
LPIVTAVHTTKPAETLKKFFCTRASFCQRAFPIWDFRKAETLRESRRSSVATSMSPSLMHPNDRH